MRQIADGLFLLRGFPPNSFNVYLMGDVLVDSGTRYAKRRVLRQIESRPISAHALTHAHFDHQGSSKEVCQRFDVPLWCGAGDTEAMETGRMELAMPDRWPNRLMYRALAGPSYPVSRRLSGGDEVASFTVLEVPGHTHGHVAYWRESDRALILGDVLVNQNLITRITGLFEPPKLFTMDPPRNRESARRLAQLEPQLVCFGHGPPLRDTQKFIDFVASLP